MICNYNMLGLDLGPGPIGFWLWARCSRDILFTSLPVMGRDMEPVVLDCWTKGLLHVYASANRSIFIFDNSFMYYKLESGLINSSNWFLIFHGPFCLRGIEFLGIHDNMGFNIESLEM